ncbi:uncharacterized protein LAESUDRAFT_717952 [Laetiporus sulphureus 93-53]|uniref:Uncharacterized protein n=1 Tax=Laetiporus sulphureus 93-53 TaxID=1314785 RepID=A0A165BCR2_9APHY|nr:uncharacterized protein LAESUDRAFT_717952 [Laetiporus sulphureus 93-53]KZT00754.1 hypothetical protein LAESUDRAFT_717952 [Laetiporus sulphureus 93-53]
MSASLNIFSSDMWGDVIAELPLSAAPMGSSLDVAQFQDDAQEIIPKPSSKSMIHKLADVHLKPVTFSKQSTVKLQKVYDLCNEKYITQKKYRSHKSYDSQQDRVEKNHQTAYEGERRLGEPQSLVNHWILTYQKSPKSFPHQNYKLLSCQNVDTCIVELHAFPYA